MDKRKLILLLGAMVIAIGTALAARSIIASSSATRAQAAPIPVAAAPKGPQVLVAQRTLTVGTILTADSISYQEWPKEMVVQDAYFLEGQADMSKLLGTVVRYPIPAGQPITQGALVAPGDHGFLAAALGPGMRAITVPVSGKTGVGGFIFPGDHVDLMLTQTVGGSDGSRSLKATETFLRNIRVLATNQSAKSTIAEGQTVVSDISSVTLEVTPKIAEKIEVAQTVGTLSLVLRSIADNQSDLDKAIASGAVKVPAGASKAEEDKMLSDAMNHPVEGASSFVTGGDVSRFQPRTAPPSTTRADGGEFTGRSGSMTHGDSNEDGSSAGSPAPTSPAVAATRGPVVRVTRGQVTTSEPAGR